jgi:superfamily II DNA or RNA helicase
MEYGRKKISIILRRSNIKKPINNFMVQKPISYPGSKCAEMAILLHRFEATKVAGPGTSRRKITDVLWTLEEATQYLELSDEEIPTFERLIKSLQEQNHLLKISESVEGADGYISRTAETLRIIGHTYEYWHRGRPGVDAIRWEIVPKYIPRRDITPEDFINKLIQEISEKTGNEVADTSLGEAIRSAVSGIETHFREIEKIKQPKFSDFQFRATKQGILDSLGLGGRGSILVAGVGSGKTLAFMLPPLILAKRDIIDENRNYGAHLFLYPRKALALDQFSKSLKPFAKAVGIPISQVHSEMGKHYRSLSTNGTVAKGIKAVHTAHTPPRLIISSLETLKNRIAHPIIVNKLFSRIKTVVFDEVHLQSGVQGAQAAMLMRRMKVLCSDNMTWVGASATIAKPEDHLGRLFGIDSNKIKLIEPWSDEMQIDGVVHHAFMRPSGLIAQGGVLSNATSLLVHHRRDNLSIRPGPKQSKNAPKVITFADNLEILGSWNDDFRENERTDVFQTGPGQVRFHPNNENMETWDARMRELPYARRFQNTLERRIEAHGGKIPDSQPNGGGIALAAVFVEWRGKDVCKRCKNGERFDLGHADEDTMMELSKLVHRVDTLETRERDKFLPFMINNDEIFLKPGIVGTQEKCPYLQAAACTSFSSHPVEEVKRIGDSSGGVVKFDFASRATSNIQSSKSEDFSEFAEDLSQAVFRAPNHILHNVDGAKGDDFVDVVMASPSLEVGVDLPNLTESVMTRAVRNLASYRQKAGRVGRESMSEALNLTLATDSANDLHYYRQPRKLVDRGRLEPVPLKEKNEAVARSTAYLATWDLLVKRGKLPEVLRDHSSNSAHIMVKDSYDYISDLSNKNAIQSHICKVLADERYEVGTNWFDEAISQVEDELKLLLKPISGYQFEPELPEPKSVIAAIRHIRSSGRTTNPARPVGNTNQLVEEYENSLSNCRDGKTRIGFLSIEHSDLLSRIDRFLRNNSPTSEVLNELIDEVSSIRDSFSNESEKKNNLRNFSRRLMNLLDALEDLNYSGIDMLAFRAVEQYQKLTMAEEGGWKSYYFSATIRSLDVFKQVKRNPWFVSPDTLYIHPHMKMVKLTDPEASSRENRWKKLNLRDDQALIPLSEALHSFLPGMWTKRLPQSTFKVLVRETVPISGRTLQASLERMEQGGFKYEVVKKSLPPPPGLIGDFQVISPLEIPIRPLINKRTLKTALLGPAVLDGDEGKPVGETSNPRIPKSFFQTWLNIELDDGKDIQPYVDLDDAEKLIDTHHGEGSQSEIDVENIVHPFSESAFSSIKWHKGTIATEYVYGLSRTLNTEKYYSTELFYANARGAYIAFGQKINTEGIAFTLDNTSFEEVKASGLQGIVEGSPEWTPSMIRAFRSYLREIALKATGKPLSNFVIDDIVAILIAIWRKDNCPNLNLEQLKSISTRLVNDSELLQELVINRVDAMMKTPDDETRMTEDDTTVRNNRIDEMRNAIRNNLTRYLSTPLGFSAFLPKWLHRTILMSFGVSAVGATQRIAGGDSKEIGFGLTDESWEGNSTTVVVYDRAECGNGNVSVARTFMHIPNIVRSAKGSRGKFLPTIDFLSTLEEILLPCPQQHCDILGLEYLRTNGSDSVLHRSMVDYTEFGKEIHKVGKSVWSALNIQGPKDGWKLPLFHYMRKELAVAISKEQDDVTRSTRICWNGCPECIERIDIVQGGYAGMDYLDKSVMDFWFRHLRKGSNEYIDMEPDSMLNGDSGLQLGDLHSLALDTSRGRIRSLMLPWTIGVDLDRANLEEGIRLIIRQSDLVGLRQSDPNHGIAMGMPSSAFKRLLWFDLLMTAYLDMRGAIQQENKKIKLVYYDARDISFDDIGLAPQLLEALRAQAKSDKAGLLENFSDMLKWLAKRGFEIQICIDKRVRNNPQNGPVRDFVNKLGNSSTESRIQLFEREVLDDNQWTRSMHKKTMITPLFVLKGTANMTRSGAGLNEEDVDHVMFGNPQYESMASSCEDTISQATRLN